MAADIIEVKQALDGLLAAFGPVAEEALKTRFSPDALLAARQIYDFTMNYPVDWSNAKLDGVLLDSVTVAVQAKYPFLDDEALRALRSQFAYSWK